MARGDYTGERFGDWYVESRAKPVDGKRFWNVTNTVTDEARVVAQTELKNLANEETDMPASADITARVLIGNFKDDPFNLPDGVLPEDDDEYPFTVEFVEPAIGDIITVGGIEFIKISDNPFETDDQISFDDIDDDDRHGVLDDIDGEISSISIPANPWAEPSDDRTMLDDLTSALVLKAIDELAESLHGYLGQAVENWRTSIIRTVSSNA
jgi:hypothetical protein